MTGDTAVECLLSRVQLLRAPISVQDPVFSSQSEQRRPRPARLTSQCNHNKYGSVQELRSTCGHFKYFKILWFGLVGMVCIGWYGLVVFSLVNSSLVNFF